ncbi:MAG: DEAD/DEAH box helicase family protein [Saprospiraceae bacterium]|nr:DEAD/DEAH box helicase family protein [Saprospiraceae bacterium]
MDKYKVVEFDGKDYVSQIDIEYKMVDVEQFTSCGYDVIQSNVVPDEDGYVTDDLISKIDIKQKSTDVINVATGSGKTTAIYKLIKKILSEDKQSIIIMATPFKSLVEKDMRELTGEKYGIDTGIITNYRYLDEEPNKKMLINLYLRIYRLQIL